MNRRLRAAAVFLLLLGFLLAPGRVAGPGTGGGAVGERRRGPVKRKRSSSGCGTTSRSPPTRTSYVARGKHEEVMERAEAAMFRRMAEYIHRLVPSVERWDASPKLTMGRARS
jgi:hypothetical protein